MLQFTKVSKCLGKLLLILTALKERQVPGGTETECSPWPPRGNLFILPSSLLAPASGTFPAEEGAGKGTVGGRCSANGALQKLY